MRGSRRRSAAASRAAAASTNSSACAGTIVMREMAPGWWPLRPARCSRRATPLGEPICSTWSTGVKSTPRSRLDVHTTAFSLLRRRPFLDPVAHVALQRPVMQGDAARPVGPRLEDRLVPDLGGRTDVGEHQRRARAVDGADHLGQQLQADVPRPRKAVDGGGVRGGDLDRLGVQSLDDASARGAHAGQARERLVEIGQGGGQSPHAQRGAQSRAPVRAPVRPARRACSTSARATRRRSRRTGARALPPVGARQHQRQALRRGDQRRRQALHLPRAGRRRGVAGAHVHGPVRLQRARGAREGQAGVGGQRAQRRDPQDGQRRRRVASPAGQAAAAESTPRRSCPCRWARAGDRFAERERRPTSSWNANGDQPCAANHARAGSNASMRAAGPLHGASPSSASVFTATGRGGYRWA